MRYLNPSTLHLPVCITIYLSVICATAFTSQYPISSRPSRPSTVSSKRVSRITIQKATPRENGDGILDAVVIDNKDTGKNLNDDPFFFAEALNVGSSEMSIEKVNEKKEGFKGVLRNLANLSLVDYKWRSALFKNEEADRKVQESLARMIGEEPAYVRPMDASEEKIGPLGRAEKDAVKWLSSVIEEEGVRAQKILSSEGELIRPIQAVDDPDSQTLGPLASLEKRASDLLQSIISSENMRVEEKKLRPMQLEESKRGPLGNFEAKAVQSLKQLTESEKMRMDMSRRIGHDTIVRPMDVPGPLGEMEKKWMDVVSAEKVRMRDRQNNEGKLVRPKDASLPGPLGKAEEDVVQRLELIKTEEEERLRNIQKVLEDNRPMDVNRLSLLGIAEALLVGVMRGPTLFLTVFDRVKELLDSEVLGIQEEDQRRKGEDQELRLSGGKKEKDGKDFKQ